ncbi:uncharacterized protein LOC135173020 [Diachasmimorpha longicaudata]|uniref:uncharacterized protein LOC135173020 n=1 Tax=Diachasmimorpha longicaudata TaxID=58733 RepID=UPI0030B8ED2D
MSQLSSAADMDFAGIKPIRYTRWLLTIVGIWPVIKRYSTPQDHFLAIIVRLVCYLLAFFAMIPGLYFMFFRKATSVKDKVALVGPVGFWVMVTMKYTIMIYRQKGIKKCIEHIETDWQRIKSQEEHDIVFKNFLISKKITIICASFIYSGGLSYHTVVPFVVGSAVTTDREDRPLIFPGYDDAFDVYATPVYHFVFLSHCLGAFIMYTVSIISCNLAASFCIHACSQLQIVILKLNGLVERGYNECSESLRDKLKSIVWNHVRVQRYAADIERVLREICLVEILTSVIIICWLEYFVLKTWDDSETIGIVTYFILLMSLTFNIFVFCFIGELLKEQWNETGKSAYLLDWDRVSPKIARAIILIIATAQVPKKITAGGLLELTYTSFTSVNFRLICNEIFTDISEHSEAYEPMTGPLNMSAPSALSSASFSNGEIDMNHAAYSRISALTQSQFFSKNTYASAQVPASSHVFQTSVFSILFISQHLSNVLHDTSMTMSVDKVKNSSEEIETIQLTRWLLITLGLWPFVTDNSTIIETFLGIIIQILSYGLLFFTIVPTTYHIFMREQNLDAKITLIGPICFFTTNFLKYCAIVYHREDIKQCLNSLKTDWQLLTTQSDRDIMMKSVSTGRNLTIFFAIFMYSGGMFYHTFMPFLIGSPVTNAKNTSTRPLVYAGYDILFDPYISPVYEIVFFSHCLTAMVVHTIVTVSCNLAASFVAHACGQIQIIIVRLNSLIDDIAQDSARSHRKMASIIDYHARVIRFTVDVEVILREICMIEVVASTFVICLLEYYILATWNGSEIIGILTYLVLLVALSVNVFIFCFIGEKLTQQCYEVSKAVYMIKWYRLPPDVAIALVLFLANAQVPRKITAGGYMDLSLNSFVKVLKTSVVYLNLLRTVEN